MMSITYTLGVYIYEQFYLILNIKADTSPSIYRPMNIKRTKGEEQLFVSRVERHLIIYNEQSPFE